MTEYLTVPVNKITTREGFNPRTDVEVDTGLVNSVKEHGVLHPLEVRPNGKPDEYYLVSGERRLTAATLAGLKEVPVLVLAKDISDDQELLHALLENLHREDLSPLDQAKALQRLRDLGYTNRKTLAAKTGLSEKQIKEREQILSLPEPLQAAVARKELTLNAVDEFARVASHSPALAAVIFECGTKEFGWTPAQIAEDMSEIAGNLAETGDDDADYCLPEGVLFAKKGHITYVMSDFDFGEELNSLIERYNQAAHPVRLVCGLSPEAIDAATAYGCYLELTSKSDYWQTAVITDLEWLTDRFKAHWESNKKDLIAKVKEIESGKPVDDAPGIKDPNDPIKGEDTRSWEEKEADRKKGDQERRNVEREQWKVDQERAEAYNEQLAKQVFERVRIDKADPVIIDVLIALATADHGAEWALRGLRYIHPGWKIEGETPSGKPKTSLVEDRDTAAKRLAEFLEAPTVEGKLTKFSQLYLAAFAADENQVARTRRTGHIPTAGRVPGAGEKLGAAFNKLRKKLTPKLAETVQETFSACRDNQGVRDPFADYDPAGYNTPQYDD